MPHLVVRLFLSFHLDIVSCIESVRIKCLVDILLRHKEKHGHAYLWIETQSSGAMKIMEFTVVVVVFKNPTTC